MMMKQKREEQWQEIEPQLQVADIILARENTWLSRTIRNITDSYWSHSLIVFAVPDDNIFNNVLVISAEKNGIEIHRIQKYTQNFDFFDLGVKRVPGLSPQTREMVLSYVLNNVDLPYDFKRLFGFLFDYLGHKVLRKKINMANFNEHAFICSSFIQKAFYTVLPEDKKDSVVFKNDRSDKFFLEKVTPADIARSQSCQWIYNPHE